MAGPVVCHLPNGEQITLPAPAFFPSIPQPDGTLAGATAAIHQLKHAVELLSGQRNAPSGAGFGFQKKKDKGGRFVEVHRSMKTERITNKQDPSQFVDVETVEQLTMRDTVTGETWTWHF